MPSPKLISIEQCFHLQNEFAAHRYLTKITSLFPFSSYCCSHLDLAELLAERPALEEGGVDAEDGHEEARDKVVEGESSQDVPEPEDKVTYEIGNKIRVKLDKSRTI